MKTKFDPTAWTGDPAELDEMASTFLNDERLCAATFATSSEAFSNGYRLGRRSTVDDQLRAFLADQPWADLRGAIETIDEALGLALKATPTAFSRWDADEAG